MQGRSGAVLVTLVLLAGCATKPEDDLWSRYRAAIARAAVKQPGDVADLLPIDTSRPAVAMVSFYGERYPPFDAAQARLVKQTWVSLPPQLAERCRARGGDKVLALEQILGMPPVPDGGSGGRWMLASFSAPPASAFRPCASSPDVTTRQCSLTLGDNPQSAFVYRQIWTSYQTGTGEAGYPFTGMGWTYDWGTSANPPVGVSEYVVAKGTPIGDVHITTPAAFCGGT